MSEVFLYDDALSTYLKIRDEVDRVEAEAKRRKAELRAEMSRLEAQITAHAHQDGLETIPAKCGTGYWSTHYNCTCASRDDLFDYVKAHQAWDLLEARPSKSAVRSLVDATGEPPPGVNFSAYRVFNVRDERKANNG